MATHIDYHPTSNRLVQAALATELISGRVSKVKVWLKALIELTPTAVDFIQNNNLVPEFRSKAGIDEETEFSAYTQLSYEVEDVYHVYELQLTVAS